MFGLVNQLERLNGNLLSPQRASLLIVEANNLILRLHAVIDTSVDTTVDYQLQPIQVHAGRGRPRKELDPQLLKQALDLRFTLKEMSEMFGTQGVSIGPRSIRRRLVETHERQPWEPSNAFSPISDQQLGDQLEKLIAAQPHAGINMLLGGLRSRGIYVQRDRLEEIRRIRYPAREMVQTNAFPTRDKYHVAGPNSVWHHDGQHGLVNFGIVIHAFVDGFSRTITGIQASTNNLAQTVLALFLLAVSLYGLPSRLRGDRGGENVEVAREITRLRGAGRGSYLWGV